MYFNYTTFWPDTWWGRRSFLNAWWRVYAGDPQWAPPAYGALRRVVTNADHPFYVRLDSQLLYLEALPRRSGSGSFNPNAPAAAGITFEEPVGAAVLQIDRRRHDGAAYLGLLRCANDEEALERLLSAAFERAAEAGCTHLLGPTGVLPAWQPGVLLDHFHRLPPWHTPYNPPYLSDLLGTIMEPWLETALYAAPVGEGDLLEVPPPGSTTSWRSPAPAVIEPLPLARLAGDLLPLLATALTPALTPGASFPAPDALEAQTLLDWLGTTVAPAGFLATVDGTPAGFLLVQPDLAPLLRRSGGGRGWLRHGWLAWRKSASVTAGRVLLGAVGAEWRGRGVGRQIWRHALAVAQARGWRTLTCGPVPPDSEAGAFLQRQGARAEQRYRTYSWSPG